MRLRQPSVLAFPTAEGLFPFQACNLAVIKFRTRYLRTNRHSLRHWPDPFSLTKETAD